MIPIKVDLIKKAKRPGYAMKPEYITIHQTGNAAKGADAEMHNRYVHSVAPNPSWHYTVDGGTSDGKKAPVIYQHLPLTENGWHAGDGTNGPGNRKSIAIEICVNRDGNLAKAEANAAWLAAKLIKEVGSLKPFPACMKQHYDWSKKNCPAQIRGRKNGWAGFLAAVESHLKTEAEITRPIGIYVDGKKADEVGYLIDNATYVRASYLVALIGGSVTGHGDHINIVLPTRPDPAVVEKLRTDLAAANKKIEAARRALGA
ncbi:peptidoglycan recognition protein family protein [Candidatus Darwinibacter acetoxidans]